MTYDATGGAGAGTGVSEPSTTEQAKERAAELATQAQDKLGETVKGQVDQRSVEAADKVESVADDVRAVSDSLSDRGQDAAARIVEQGADYAQQLSDYLRSSSSDQILEDVAAFARRKPWAVAGGGLLLGFAASRVMRASATPEPATSTSAQNLRTGTYGSGTYASSASGFSAQGPSMNQPPAYPPYESTMDVSGTSQMPAPVTSDVDRR